MIVRSFLSEDGYVDMNDYWETVGEVAGAGVRSAFNSAWKKLIEISRPRNSGAGNRETAALGAYAALLTMPEGDFLSALEVGVRTGSDAFALAGLVPKLNRVCERRGIPYRVTGVGRLLSFEWVGDQAVQREALEPALGALDDPRLAGGPRTEFTTARRELRQGTAESLKHAVAEACNAVESTMKVLLDVRGEALPRGENAGDLFSALESAGIVSKQAEELVLSPSRFGNRRGRHGAGAVAHDVTAAEAQAVAAAAATAISFLASELP